MSNFRIFSIGAVAGYFVGTVVEVLLGYIPDSAFAINMAFWGLWTVTMFGDRK